MDRRGFVALLGGAITCLDDALAQSPGRIPRIGFLASTNPAGTSQLEAFLEGLRSHGYVEGKSIAIEYRWAEGRNERMRSIAEEFVALGVDAILTHALAGAVAAARATSRIPIVMADGGDPVANGLADSLARPGRNVTGSTSFIVEEIGKRLQLLQLVVPRIRRLAFPYSLADAEVNLKAKRQALREAAALAKVEVQEFQVREASDLPEVFNEIGRARCDAALINNEPLLNSQVGVIAGLAQVMRLPAVGYASFADAGGLIAYGADRPALYGRAGHFLDLIFKGAKPGDIPFERAAKFDTIVNLRTAKALGLAVPQSVLLRADRVIE